MPVACRSSKAEQHHVTLSSYVVMVAAWLSFFELSCSCSHVLHIQVLLTFLDLHMCVAHLNLVPPPCRSDPCHKQQFAGMCARHTHSASQQGSRCGWKQARLLNQVHRET